jgi:hypothetical protein
MGISRPENEAKHSPSSSAVSKTMWSFTSMFRMHLNNAFEHKITLTPMLLCVIWTMYIHVYRRKLLWYVDPLPSNSCVNRRQYNSHC